jgi:hypothetical protein
MADRNTRIFFLPNRAQIKNQASKHPTPILCRFPRIRQGSFTFAIAPRSGSAAREFARYRSLKFYALWSPTLSCGGGRKAAVAWRRTLHMGCFLP